MASQFWHFPLLCGPNGDIQNPKIEIRNKCKIRNTNAQNCIPTSIRFEFSFLVIWICFEFRASDFGFSLDRRSPPGHGLLHQLVDDVV
jgi:hypothetical protein